MAVASALAPQAVAQSSADGEEIVVTAQKRAQAAQDVAASLSVMSGAALENRGVGNVQSLAQQIPNVQWGEQASASLVTIRGVGTSVDTGIAEPNVAIHVDGVFLPRATMAGLDLVDVGRVEVLRGPQGTLYGRNSTGGSINIVSRQPSDELEGEIQLGYGNYDTFSTRAYVSGPLSDQIRGRLSAFYTKTDGFYENLRTGSDEADASEKYGVRGALSADLSENVTVDLSAYYQVLDQDSFVGQQPRDHVPAYFAALGGSAAGVEAARLSLKPHAVYSDYGGENRITTLGLNATLSWDIGDDLSFKSISGYVDHTLAQSFDGDGTDYNQTIIGRYGDAGPRIGDADMFSQEFNLSGKGERLTWVLGAYYFTENFSPSIPAPVPNGFPAAQLPPTGLPPGSVIVQSAEQETTSYALFADATLSITEKLRLSLGVRQSWDDVTMTQTSGVAIPGVPPALTASCVGLVREIKEESFTPRAALEFDAAENILLYAQYSKGFRGGGFNISDCADDFEPEEVQSYEAGVKSTFLDKNVTLNVSVFQYDYSGLQIFQIDGFTQQINNADATVKGVDLEFVWNVTDAFTVNVAGSLLDATYDEFLNLDPLDPMAGYQDLSGKHLNRAPDYTIGAGAEYAVSASELGLGDGEFRFRGEVFHSAKVFFRPFNLPADTQKAYTVGNLFASYESGEGGYLVRAYVKNVGDVEYWEQLLANSVMGVNTGHYAPPRTFGVELSLRF